jgi:hypothetical protein
MCCRNKVANFRQVLATGNTFNSTARIDCVRLDRGYRRRHVVRVKTTGKKQFGHQGAQLGGS